MMEESSRVNTDELLKILFKERSLEHFLQKEESSFLQPSFAAYLTNWCKSHQVIPGQLIARANLDKSFGHQLFSGERNPSRDTVLQLAFAMKADVPQAQEMLRVAGKSTLYPRIKRDTVIIFCLHNHVSLGDTEIILYDLGLPLLGGRNR